MQCVYGNNDKSRAEQTTHDVVVEWVKASAARSRDIFNYHYKMGVISWLTRTLRDDDECKVFLFRIFDVGYVCARE